MTNDSAAIVEVACGPGNITKYLLNKRPGFKIGGIDLAPNMVELAKVNNPTASFQVMDSRKDLLSTNNLTELCVAFVSLTYLKKASLNS